MWPLLAIGVVVLGFAVFWFGLVPPPNAGTLIRIHNGELSVKRGTVRSHAKDSMADILRAAGVKSGFIAIVAGPRVKFSRSIPAAIQQRLRNVLLNQ